MIKTGDIVRCIREPQNKRIKKYTLYKVKRCTEGSRFIDVVPLVESSDWDAAFARGWHRDRFKKLA